MPVTLEQVKLNLQDDLSRLVIDEFAKNNFLLNNLPFHPCVSPTGGGGTLTHSYTRLITQPTAGFRAINDDYTPQAVEKERYSVDLAVFGGSFSIDRVLTKTGGIVNEVYLQATQKIKAAQALFNDTVINGDVGVNANAFDGLDKALTGSSTEMTPAAVIDLSSTAAIDANYRLIIDMLNRFLSKLDGKPTALMGNGDMIAVIQSVAQRAGQYQTTTDNFGNLIERYRGIPLVDLGAKSGTNDPVVATTDGVTSLYAARFGMDGFHAVSMAGMPPIELRMPDFTQAGTVKTGDVEMVAAVVLKATKAAGVLRNIKVS